MSSFRKDERRSLLLIGMTSFSLTIITCFCIAAAYAAYIFSRIDTSNLIILPPPQDCMAVRIALSGSVQSAAGEAIPDATVHIRSDTPGYYLGDLEPVDQTVITGGNGEFAVSEDLLIFPCDDLIFEASAEGFEIGTTTYSAMFDQYIEQRPLPVRIEIVLQPRIDPT